MMGGVRGSFSTWYSGSVSIDRPMKLRIAWKLSASHGLFSAWIVGADVKGNIVFVPGSCQVIQKSAFLTAQDIRVVIGDKNRSWHLFVKYVSIVRLVIEYDKFFL